MAGSAASALAHEHRDFFMRFRSFWAAPSGVRVAELIRPDAKIHFSGLGTFTGAEYVDIMQGMLDSMVGLTVTPLDYAGDENRLYIFWQTTTVISGKSLTYMGIDRFLLESGMAVEEHVIFDTSIMRQV